MTKGFTLIELLAVIVILAIIALIATPIILNIIEDSRLESKKRSIDNYAHALSNEIMRKQMSGGLSTIDDAIESVQYTGSNVSCETNKILKSGEIYLDNCSVDGEAIENYSYGKRKHETSPMILTGETANNKITGYTLDKTGNIGLDIYAKVSGTSHITYSINGASAVSVDPKKDKEGNTYYTVPVAPDHMNRSIVIKLYSGETEVDSLTTTIKDYCNTILSNSAYSDSHEFIKALVTFGSQVQQAFNTDTSTLVDSILSEPIDLDSVPLDESYISSLPYVADSGTRTGYGIGWSFEFLSYQNERIRFNLKNGTTIDEIATTYDGNPVTPRLIGSTYTIIVPHNYLEMERINKIVFTKGNEVLVVHNSQLAVLWSALTTPGYESIVPLCKSTIYYYQEGNNYYY